MRIVSNTFADIYKQLLENIYNNPDYISSPRGMKIKESTNIEIVLTDPTSNLFYNEYRSPKLEYLYPELLWYFLGRNDLSFISKYSKFWNKLTTNGILNSAYGNLIFTQKNKYGYSEYTWALTSLIRDKDSRQAIIRFNKPEHSYNNNLDFVCTLNGIFNIRDNKLNFTTIMRSQDVWFGIIYDIPFFTILMQQMLSHLKKYYPELELGVYTHYVISEHIYEKDFDGVLNMLKHPFVPKSTPLLNEDLIESSGKPSKLLDTVLINLNLITEYNPNIFELMDMDDDLMYTIMKYSIINKY